MISTVRFNLNNVITQSGLIISGDGSIWRLWCSGCRGKDLLDHHHHFHHCSIINKPSSSSSSLLESANTQIRRWTAKTVFSHLAWLICTPTSTNMQHPLASTRRYAWRGFLHTFLYQHTTALGKWVQPNIKLLKSRKMSQDFTSQVPQPLLISQLGNLTRTSLTPLWLLMIHEYSTDHMSPSHDDILSQWRKVTMIQGD